MVTCAFSEQTLVLVHQTPHYIQPLFKEFVERGTVPPEKLRMNTPWGTHEFGFYDLNKNAIFIVQDI
ncbi:MAG: hypothetical protein AAF388_13775 [Bacteroidota bacterium]